MDWSGLSAILRQLDLRWALAGSLSTLGLIAGLALRWRIFLRQQQIDLPYASIFRLTWAGQFFNSILPGSTGGDVVKIFQICRLAPDRKAAAVSTVFVDRLSALAALLVLAGVAVLLDPKPLDLFIRAVLPLNAWVTAVLMAAIAMLAGVLVYRLLRDTEWHGRIARTLAAAAKNLTLNWNLALAVALAFAIHLLSFMGVYLFARALRIPITYGQVLLMMPVIVFLLLIPVTINGHGLREILLIGYFTYLGVSVSAAEVRVEETAVALSIVAVANDLLWSLPGGLWYLARGGGRTDADAAAVGTP